MATNTDEVKPQPEDNAQVSAMSCNLPSFWSNNPEVWFAMAEAKFSLANIKSEQTKFNYVLSVLSPEIANEVYDIIIKPDLSNPYTKLKEALIGRMAPSETQKLKQLLSGLELGDRKPSQLLRHMRTLVGEGDTKPVTEEVLRELFLQQMPTNIQPVLVSLRSLPLVEVAGVADKILETTPSAAISAVVQHDQPTVSSCTTETGILQELIEKMNKLLTKLDGSTPPQRSRSRSRNSKSTAVEVKKCWYHHRFGDNAKKCTSPCIFQKNEAASQR